MGRIERSVNALSASELQATRKLIRESESRKVLSLRLYEPIHDQQKSFHESRALQLVAVGSNRGGKTLTAAIEVARFALNCDPIKPERNATVDQQEMEQLKEQGAGWLHRRIIVVGRDLEHIATVMWRKLGRAGAFKMIRDAETNDWRTFDPVKDVKRQHEAKLAPPLISPSAIRSSSWENKAQGIPTAINLVNGTELRFYSGKAEPPQGQDVDMVWLDEEIRHEQWYPEMMARLLDRKGRLIWSATPENATEALFNLSERADQSINELDATVQKFFFHIEQNPHIGKQEREEFWNSLSPEQRRVKYHGEFKITGHKIYPEFDYETHGINMEELPGGQIPPEWTRYAILDPGRQRCGTMFAAVSPDELHVYVYDELFITNCTADMWGDQFAKKASGQEFAAFIIDHSESGKAVITSGRTQEWHYSDALKQRKVESWMTGNGFIWGSDDFDGGLEAVRRWLMIRGDGPGKGTTRLKFVRGKVPEFCEQMKRYYYKMEAGRLTNRPNRGFPAEFPDDLRYLAMYNPRYVKRPKNLYVPPIIKYLEKKRRKAMGDSRAVVLGPGVSIR